MRHVLAAFIGIVSVSLAAQAPPGVLAIRDITVIPATGGPSMPATTVLIRGDRIFSVGPSDAVAIPPGARVIDGTGKYLMPGLIDMHVHLSKTRGSSLGLFVVSG